MNIYTSKLLNKSYFTIDSSMNQKLNFIFFSEFLLTTQVFQNVSNILVIIFLIKQIKLKQ
jgi:hypothetical protein